MIRYNDLIGLQYRYGAQPGDGSGYTDCWQLCAEVRRRLGLKTGADQFDWVYEQYSQEAANLRLLAKLLRQYAQKIKKPLPGSLFNMSNSQNKIILATVLDDGNCLFVSPGKMVVAAPVSITGAKHFYWAE